MKEHFAPTFFAILLITALIAGCSKEGPAGATGATGATGPAGPGGPAGPTGPAGSANVIYSAWATSPYESRDTTVDGTCLKVRHILAPSITTNMLTQGLMMTYFRVGSIGPYQLPYVSDAGGATNQVGAIYALGKIIVFRHTYNTCRFTSAVAPAFTGQPVMINIPQSLEYRYVLVPGVVSGGRGVNGTATYNGYTEEELKSMPYNQVTTALGIPAEGTNIK